MIIILKGADFSASNIGTLSTWRISRSLGTGATYEGPTNVDKGAALNATVTLMEGYEVGAAGVTITMSGIELNDAHSISDNVITIAIAEVTGNVLIKVPTVNISTGEEEEPEVPGGSGEVTTTDITNVFEFIEAGGVNYSNGENTTDSNYQRTDYIDISNYTSLDITMPLVTNPTTSMGYAFYDTNKTYVSGIKNPHNATWSYEVQTLEIPDNAKYIRVMWFNTPHPAGIGMDVFSCIATTGKNSGGNSGSETPDNPTVPDTPTSSNDLTSLFTWTTGSINATTGGEDTAADWVKSDYVPLNGAKNLDLMMIRTTSGSTTKGMAFYDTNKTYISGVANNLNASPYMTPELREIKVPANAAYLRSSWCSTGNQKYNEEISNISHFYCIAEGDETGSGDSGTVEEVDITDQFTWTEGSRIVSGGAVSADKNWKYSNYVDVSEYGLLKVALPATTVAGSNSSCAFYDESQQHVQSINITTGAPAMSYDVKTIDVPSGAKYFRTMWYSTNHAAYNPEWTFNCIGVK